MPIIETDLLNAEAARKLSATDAHQIYNGLDAAMTHEIFSKIDVLMNSRNTPSARLIYGFERGMQAVALDMMLRGFKIDEYERRSNVEELNGKLKRIQGLLDRFTSAIWGKGLNPNSPAQLKEFFYFSDQGLGLPPVELTFKGERKVTTNREALEKLSLYFQAVPIINCILALRDIKKQLSVLTTEISPDGRFRSSYNVAGTTSGRWSSSADAFGDGSNNQNITPKIRKCFIADPRKKLLHLDLEQAESRAVGLLVWALVGDPAYLDACESGDLHTYVAKLLWPEKVVDKATAETIFYRHFTYRDMSKRGGHASNYRVTPFTMSRHLKIALDLAKAFQEQYFGAFTGIPKWHLWEKRELDLIQESTTPLGRERTFFGRPEDDATLREKIAYRPQSLVADLLNYILWTVWDSGLPIEVMTQEHDGFTLQFEDDPDLETELCTKIKALAEVPLTMSNEVAVNGSKGKIAPALRTLVIPSDISVGWNWGTGEKPPFVYKDEAGRMINKNPNGLCKWRGKPDGRKRIEGLDRVVS